MNDDVDASTVEIALNKSGLFFVGGVVPQVEYFELVHFCFSGCVVDGSILSRYA